jgi:hypothetical protein
MTESLCAALEPARMTLLSGVRSDVSSLMLKSVEALITQREFVQTREIWPVVHVSSHHLWYHTDGRHLCFPLLLLLLRDKSQFLPRSLLLLLESCLGI